MNSSISNLVAKRTFDVISGTIALILLAPAFLVISLAILVGSPGPIFYKASRVGINGKTFKMYKFRTMVVDADKMGPGLTMRDDKRITPVGRLLRKSKLDELPQLINILRGEMSFVGPRPEDPHYVALYTASQRVVLKVRPGITSPASILYRDESALITGPDWETHYIQNVMQDKLRLDLEYVQQLGVRRDLEIIAKTVQKLWSN
jgi:lipopolysaccharide/colanic/teichoic acid biosynthesis glycosyltransferase